MFHDSDMHLPVRCQTLYINNNNFVGIEETRLTGCFVLPIIADIHIYCVYLIEEMAKRLLVAVSFTTWHILRCISSRVVAQQALSNNSHLSLEYYH